MQPTIVLDNQIFWYRDISQAQSPADILSPTFYKKIKSQISRFEQNFDYSIEILSESLFTKKFMPLYRRYVVSKKNYHLNEADMYRKMIENLLHSPHTYYLLLIYHKGQPEILYGGTIFRVGYKPKLSLAFAYKGYDHLITREFKLKLSLDYWSEYLIQTYALKLGCQAMFHGKDKHPHENAGLSFFKLRAGAFPLSGLINKELILNRENLAKVTQTFDTLHQQPIQIYFTNPDQNGFFKTAYLLFNQKEGKVEQFEESKKVLENRNFEVITEIY